MKRFINVVLLMLVISATAHAQSLIKTQSFYGGHRGGNGGISVAADFTMLAYNFVTIWENACQEDSNRNRSLHCRYIYDFRSLLDKESSLYTTIQIEEETQAYDGKEREATNNGFNTITVNKTRWLEMQSSRNEQDQIRMIKLVVHEYFSIIGLDSSDYYQASNEVIGMILRKGILPEVITRAEGLPDLCSLNLTDDNNSIDRNELFLLEDKSFLLNDINEISRYSLKVKRACYDDSLGNICTIYIEQVDNLTAKTVYSDIYAKKATFKSVHKLREEILKQSLSKIKACQ